MKRFFRRLFAKLLRTFVADCPRCHQHFYGRHPHGKSVRIDGVNYRIVCHRCVPALPEPQAVQTHMKPKAKLKLKQK